MNCATLKSVPNPSRTIGKYRIRRFYEADYYWIGQVNKDLTYEVTYSVTMVVRAASELEACRVVEDVLEEGTAIHFIDIKVVDPID